MRNVPLWKIVMVLGASILCTIAAAPSLDFAWFFSPLFEVFGDPRAYEDYKVVKGLDLQGGLDLTYQVQSEKEEDLIKAIEVLRNRLDQLGLLNLSIQRQGTMQIRIQIPGIKDKEQKSIKGIINTVDMLKFNRVLDEQPTMFGLVPGPEDEALQGVEEKGKRKAPSWYLMKKEPEITGEFLKAARIGFDALQGRPKILLEFTDAGATKFAEITGRLLEQRLAIVLAGKVYMAPVIKAVIRDGNAEITGDFDIEEAKLVTSILKAGALPCPLKKLAENSVGATLGEETIERGKWAAISGGLLVLLYMVMYYKLSGVWADLATVVNLLMTIALLKFFGGSLTLSGIAGLMLTVGMAVDASVIIFERIKEELRAGKTVRASIDAGFDKAFLTIFDSNVTTILMAVVLYFFGSGPVKGFAVTLSLGLLANLFTAVFLVKVIMDMLYAHTTESTISI